MRRYTKTAEVATVASETIVEHDGGFRTVVRISNSLGLHARPAAKLVQVAGQFDAEIVIISDFAEADAKSILDILGLAAAQGEELELRATGSDAKEALAALQEFFNAL